RRRGAEAERAGRDDCCGGQGPAPEASSAGVALLDCRRRMRSGLRAVRDRTADLSATCGLFHEEPRVRHQPRARRAGLQPSERFVSAVSRLFLPRAARHRGHTMAASLFSCRGCGDVWASVSTSVRLCASSARSVLYGSVVLANGSALRALAAPRALIDAETEA